MAYGYEYSYTPASAFSADVNVLPSLRTVLETAFSNMNWTGKEAKLNAIEIRSASTFTVSFNDGTTIEAVSYNSEYVVHYTGSIAYVVFAAQTTATYVWFDWNDGAKDHNVVTFTTVTGSTFTVKDTYGNVITACDTDKYELQRGYYRVTVSATGYNDVTAGFFYNMEDTINVPGQKSTLCTITAFHLNGNDSGGISAYSADGVIDEATKTITCTFTDVNATAPMPTLAASWTASDNSVITVGGVVQKQGTVSGTYNDFNDGALEYVVTAEDGVTTNTYTVTAVPYSA